MTTCFVIYYVIVFVVGSVKQPIDSKSTLRIRMSTVQKLRKTVARSLFVWFINGSKVPNCLRFDRDIEVKGQRYKAALHQTLTLL